MSAPNRLPQRLPPRPKHYTAANIFDYDESRKPAGFQYQWVAVTVAGQETRNSIVAEMNGWKPVPAERHPELAGPRATAGGEIVVGGQRLMEIPMQYYQEDKEAEEFSARYAVESQVQRLGMASKKDGVKQPFKRSMDPIQEEVE